jgi:hypothetical protein
MICNGFSPTKREFCTLSQVVKWSNPEKNGDRVPGKMGDFRAISQKEKTLKTAELDRIRGFLV